MDVYLLPLVSSYPDCLLLASGISFFTAMKTDTEQGHVCYSCSAYGLECPRFCGGIGEVHYGSIGYQYSHRELSILESLGIRGE
jgi:hypothetical protein